ncbi:MAG: phage integrase family protein [Patescibacteria group bacterium]|nr:phage integrase family protein [Patescibacteria group bacterium]
MPARKPKKLPVVPPWQEVEKLLRATSRERDRLVLMLGAYMGLRVSEICGLDVPDVDFRQALLFLHEAKGGKDAVLPIPRFLVGPLRGWVGARTSGPLFPSPKGRGHLTTRAVRYLVKRTAAAAGLPDPTKARKYYPHVLRHAFCTERIRRGVPLPHVQRLMRHEQVQTTIRYTHVVPEDLREGIDR